MRTSYSVSSARRFSSWLVAALGLAAYVGLIYGLTVLPLQFEMPLPYWATFAVPAVVYGLLVLLFARRPSVLRWIVGTAVLTGLHVLLGLARVPLTTWLDPALAGRPLPWMLPPPLPELVGVFLLLVPLRDVLRARPRLARERTSSSGRSSTSVRGRVAGSTRPHPAPSSEGLDSLTETLIAERGAPSEAFAAAVAPASVPAAPPEPAPLPAPADEPRRRRGTVRTDHRPEPVTRPARRSDVVLRIALDRIMGQLPPGTFLAPEDEVAASLRDPGHLLIPGELVVTQLSEGVARIAWSDIVDQFPSQLVGLGSAEISEHLGDGLRLPLDEVVGQLPHELFVADTPEVEMAGLDRIPVPFHPMEESTPAPSLSRAAAPDIQATPVVERPRVSPGPVVPDAVPAPVVVPTALETRATPPPPPVVVSPPVENPLPAAPAATRALEPPAPVPAPRAVATSSPAFDGPTVKVSFARVVSEIPEQAFGVPLEQVADRMQQPGALLIPQALVLPQLAEGLIRVKWDVVAAQFPRDVLTLSDADMMAQLPNGISLPLDEVIAQVPHDLFMIGGPAADVRGLESFPAPFQPLVSDPEPQKASAESPTKPVAAATPPIVPPTVEPAPRPEPEPGPIVPPPAEPEPIAVIPPAPAEPEPIVATAPDIVIEESPAVAEIVDPVSVTASTTETVKLVSPEARVEGSAEPTVLVAPEPLASPARLADPEAARPDIPEPIVASSGEREGPDPGIPPEPVRVQTGWRDVAPASSMPTTTAAGAAETTEARRIVAMLAPIASFDVTIQTIEGVTVFAMAAPAVAQEITVAVAGIALPLLTDRRMSLPLDQITLRGPDTALVLTPLGSPGDHRSVLAVAAPRGGGLTLLEILCRRAADKRAPGATGSPEDGIPGAGRGFVASTMPAPAAGLAASLSAFGVVTASERRDAGGEGSLHFFLPAEMDVPMVGALVQDLKAVMRKAAGSGAVFRTAVLRRGSTLLVIQPEEVGHGRSIVVVAGGEVTRPGLAYRQVARVTAALARA